jgi:hypothetical protein
MGLSREVTPSAKLAFPLPVKPLPASGQPRPRSAGIIYGGYSTVVAPMHE